MDGAKGDLSGEIATGTIDRAQAGDLMPAVEVTDPDGATLNTGALQGGPVLLNLWATWCAPCIKELPLLDELASDYEGGLRVLTVSQDLQAERVAPFLAERQLANLPAWIDSKNALMDAIPANTLPVTILYDASGQEVWRVVGDYDWSSAAARGALDEALGGASGD
ncbi:Thioredoxin-1 [Alteripontixanthobacter maritimus]|uniref:Thioredoxin-1 n=1 Tax=Alteripontixanthobacter maritimus TaxID=2161824 RepID=A0A369Q7Z5_9SPHN|nr:Thioredoxin-1 [Alteripontixanthobacter maritimus]